MPSTAHPVHAAHAASHHPLADSLVPSLSRLAIWLGLAGLALAALAPAAAAATDIHLTAASGGQASVSVAPGAAVSWTVTGELSDSSHQGLAMFAFDLSFDGIADGGVLTPAVAPAGPPMDTFAAPLGLSNPAGFGGTPAPGPQGGLLQVGGAQNTIVNGFAPLPVGNVVTGIATSGAPVVLASGTLAAPLQVGTYTLAIGNVMANVIRTGSTGSPFWEVDPAGVGDIDNLQVIVVGLKTNVATLSVASPGVATLSLDAGLSRANRIYFLLGTIGGTSPGITLANGTLLPLNPSPYLNYTALHPNSFPLANALGLLDGSGQAVATFTLPHVPPSAAGVVIHHAYVLIQPIDFASNAVEVTLVP